MQYPYLKRLPAFEYLAPNTIEEALDLLARHGEKARILAGGTDLLLNMKRRQETPAYVISLKNIPGLDSIDYKVRNALSLGPLVRVHTIETSPLIHDKFPILAQAAAVLGSVQVRNLATVAGNLCTALPSADMAPGLIVLGAKLAITGRGRGRSVEVEEFLTGPGESVLMEGELVTEIQIPEAPPGSRMVYLKHMQRSAMDLSIVGVAALVALKDAHCSEARICLGSAGPTPLRVHRAEEILKGQTIDANLIQKAAQAASLECNPRSSMRASAEYRREMVRVLTARALNLLNNPLSFDGED